MDLTRFNKKLYFAIFVLIILAITFFSQALLMPDTLIFESLGSQLSYQQINSLLSFQQKWQWVV